MPIDLLEFCTPENAMYNLATPWVKDGWRIATDARILVQVPAPGEANTPFVVGYGSSRPDTAKVLGHDFVATEVWVPIEIERNVVKCGDCDGRGTEKGPCCECNGKGVVACLHCDQDMECDACDRTGEVGDDGPCRVCSGSGKLAEANPVTINGAIFRGDLIEKMQKLPDLRWGWKENATIVFRFAGGGEGILLGKKHGNE